MEPNKALFLHKVILRTLANWLELEIIAASNPRIYDFMMT